MVKGLRKEAEATDKSTEPLNLHFKMFVNFLWQLISSKDEYLCCGDLLEYNYFRQQNHFCFILDFHIKVAFGWKDNENT